MDIKFIDYISDFSELYNTSWSGAIDTLNKIREENKEEEFWTLLEELYYQDAPTRTELNDFIWFDRDYIFETLEIKEDE